jgi:hypothetical protein
MALPPAPPTPITLIRGRSSSTSGRMKSMLITSLPMTPSRTGALLLNRFARSDSSERAES